MVPWGDTVLMKQTDSITGYHAHIYFDADTIDYQQLLQVFFQLHDPTELNRQGNDVGTQYRSVIFYHNDTQLKLAQSEIDALERAQVWPNPIVTELSPATQFYPAENYHQDYVERNPNQPYCALMVNPKLSKFKHQFTELLK